MSVGKTDFVLVNFLNCRLKDSIVLVVYIILLIGSENWKNGQIASQFSSIVLNADEYLSDHLFFTSCNCSYLFSSSTEV